jgi:hypothetical protein
MFTATNVVKLMIPKIIWQYVFLELFRAILVKTLLVLMVRVGPTSPPSTTILSQQSTLHHHHHHQFL